MHIYVVRYYSDSERSSVQQDEVSGLGFQVKIRSIEMKKALKITSALCVIVAIAAVIFGFVAMNAGSHSFMFGYSIFRMFEHGTFLGTLGNILVMIFTDRKSVV